MCNAREVSFHNERSNERARSENLIIIQFVSVLTGNPGLRYVRTAAQACAFARTGLRRPGPVVRPEEAGLQGVPTWAKSAF